MLTCWNCEFELDAKMVLRDGILLTREARLGGPYRDYTCPRCHRHAKVETSRRGRLFASPDREFSPVDFLVGWIDAMSPLDFLAIATWHQRHAARRRHFFERDGDRRYSRFNVLDVLRQFFAGKDPHSTPTAARTSRSSQRRARASGAASSGAGPTSPVPPSAHPEHPYRILGIPEGSTELEIRAAFRTLVRKYHPDKLLNQEPQAVEEATRRLKELLEAYERLLKDR
ncbi:MAG: J domain-containing protein [Planctomycetota bacterium]